MQREPSQRSCTCIRTCDGDNDDLCLSLSVSGMTSSATPRVSEKETTIAAQPKPLAKIGPHNEDYNFVSCRNTRMYSKALILLYREALLNDKISMQKKTFSEKM